MNILIYVRIILWQKISWQYSIQKIISRCKQHFKIRKEHVLIKCLFNKAPPYLLYCKDLVKPYYVKGVHRVKKEICSQMFYKIVVLESFAKFTGKHLCWSQFLIKLQALLGESIQVFCLKVFLKILQFSKENTWECYTIFKNLYFEEYLPATASIHHKCFPMKCFF